MNADKNFTSAFIAAINPAINYLKKRHSGEGRNPEKYWMPDQVRHDGVLPFYRRFNNIFNTESRDFREGIKPLPYIEFCIYLIFQYSKRSGGLYARPSFRWQSESKH